MNRMRYCHGGRVGDGLCLSGHVTTDESVQCDMGDCCDFDWSGWTGCCRDQQNKNVKLRFRGACNGEPQDQVAKSCGTINRVTDSCLVVIENSLQMGIVQSGVNNATYIINPDEYVNFQNTVIQGTALGHDDLSATHHSLQVNSLIHGEIIERYFTEYTTNQRVSIVGITDINGRFVATGGQVINHMFIEGEFINNEFYPIM